MVYEKAAVADPATRTFNVTLLVVPALYAVFVETFKVRPVQIES